MHSVLEGSPFCPICTSRPKRARWLCTRWVLWSGQHMWGRGRRHRWHRGVGRSHRRWVCMKCTCMGCGLAHNQCRVCCLECGPRSVLQYLPVSMQIGAFQLPLTWEIGKGLGPCCHLVKLQHSVGFLRFPCLFCEQPWGQYTLFWWQQQTWGGLHISRELSAANHG